MFKVNCAAYEITFVVLYLIHSQTQDNPSVHVNPVKIVVSNAVK